MRPFRAASSAPSRGRVVAAQVLVAVLASILAAGYQFYAKYYDTTPCSRDSPIEFDVPTAPFSRHRHDGLPSGGDLRPHHSWHDTCQLYSMEYEEARAKFRRAVARYGSAVEILSLPVAPGADRDDVLTVDVAIFRGKRPGTVVHSSGLHGVEGYAGSAIQLALLQEGGVLPLSLEGAGRPTIVFLHALNPAGMREHRRSNEHNVDLNRNCIGDFPTFLRRRDPNVAGYEDFSSFLSPGKGGGAAPPVTAWYATVGIWIRLAPELLRHGFLALKAAMVSGQYHHPEGVFYGGRELEPSIRRLVEFLDSRPDVFGDAESVVWIDVHTGLGPFGKDSLHCEQTAGRPLSASQLRRDWFTTCHDVVTSLAAGPSDDGSGAFSGYGLSAGSMTTFLAAAYEEKRSARHHDVAASPATAGGDAMAAAAAAGLFIVQEFGTLPGILVGRALILDNMLYQNRTSGGGGGVRDGSGSGRFLPVGDSAAGTTAAAATPADAERFSYRSPWLRDAFYPQSAAWRASVVKRGVALVMQALEYNKALHAD